MRRLEGAAQHPVELNRLPRRASLQAESVEQLVAQVAGRGAGANWIRRVSFGASSRSEVFTVSDLPRPACP
ncbi:hypothetical protein [Streptomyces sp. NBC_01443]|uniref:hypothetical protein n=1 Tax=Streptomyces sp. NBC_01443 TaxID=2903868 RepID=UPI002250AC03|nr:hypothetical protein [Streptomyces sp. NBC_01443]MCX4633165.1 hypothetical protein [Streptomyces sp. NBC_01443]